MCNDKQRWNKNKCKCKCLKTENCKNGFFWNIRNYKCEEGRKTARLTEECKEIVDDLEIT